MTYRLVLCFVVWLLVVCLFGCWVVFCLFRWLFVCCFGCLFVCFSVCFRLFGWLVVRSCVFFVSLFLCFFVSLFLCLPLVGCSFVRSFVWFVRFLFVWLVGWLIRVVCLVVLCCPVDVVDRHFHFHFGIVQSLFWHLHQQRLAICAKGYRSPRTLFKFSFPRLYKYTFGNKHNSSLISSILTILCKFTMTGQLLLGTQWWARDSNAATTNKYIC